MMRWMIALLWVGLLGPAMAAEPDQAGQVAPSAVMPTTEAASSVPMTAPGSIKSEPITSSAAAPVATVPPDKRRGADARKCLELGSNEAIAACAEKYR